MAWLWGTSWDHFNTAQLPSRVTQVTGTGIGVSIAAVGRRSTNGLRLIAPVSTSTTCDRVRIVVAPADATAIVGTAFRCVTAFNLLNPLFNEDNSIIAVYQGSAVQVWVRLNTNGTLSVLRGSTVLGTTTWALIQNVQHQIALKVLIHASTGTVELRVDGFPWLALTGQNTRATSTAAFDEITFGYIRAVSVLVSNDWNYDDTYILDGSGSSGNDFFTDVRADAVFPDGNGATRVFTLSTGTDDFAVVDENPATDDTDYMIGSAAGDRVSLAFPTTPAPGADIVCVQVVSRIRKTDAGVATHKGLTRIGGTNYVGTELPIPSSYAFLAQGWTVKPSDSVAWSEADFNAAEFGAEKTT